MQHLQLLGVKYFMAETPEIEQQANADPALQLVAKTGPWTYTYNGALTHTTWEIYLVKDSPLVTPLANEPAVLSGVDPAPSGWLQPVTRLVRPPEPLERRAGAGRPGLVAADDGGRHPAAGAARGDDQVTDVSQTDTSVSFHVSQGGHAGPGQGVLLPQLARQRGGRPLAGDSQPHGRRADEP